ncbi:hypothetical protein GDO86_019970 [Hymenochirus boettgeri]|uniref:VLIG-type G domain-containing protein n=1 Tax=Hymenochirus boettgeri TaxID=247094 RepID=A0A8T2IFM5_9PIPI|nr:hypothetical protein GDO86_019970 [Hymenochirus boettgeri]
MPKKYQNSKLTLRDVLDIGTENVSELTPGTIEDLPLVLLRKLMAMNRTARTTQLEGNSESSMGFSVQSLFDDLDSFSRNDPSNIINPLDIVCVLIHCSDNFLQQNILSKMSVCQFAVPLLLPDYDGPSCTYLLWAMRDIVKRWRPQSLSQSKGFKEENLVDIEMPFVSFVRLGSNKLSKSKILNQVLSPVQQYQDIFIHDNMEGGNIERQISDGLIETSWYFPGGKENSDTFPEPIAVTNLRGGIEDNWTQFSFLTHISAIMFIFVDSINERECDLLSHCSKSDSELYFIITPNGKCVNKETKESLKKMSSVLNIGSRNLLIKDRTANDAELVRKIQIIIKEILKKNNKRRVNMEKMAETAVELGFKVDENFTECQTAKQCATEITREIDSVVQYKKGTMKLQGNLWKQLGKIEKEMCRLRKQGDTDMETYKSQLIERRSELHREQNRHYLPNGMIKFIDAITHLSQVEKHYFLKWLKLNLDSIARNNLSLLQTEYKEKIQNPTNKNELKELDQNISDSSLGVEHFIREMGQFYEAEKQIQGRSYQFTKLPGIAADLLLEGFPLELIDGDASNIPMQWVTDVLNELNYKTGGKCRMRVITVLGVQSTGKSTLLNTMFGLQFSVSSGRCTRGAFMTLIKVKETFQAELGCEFILVIDTEGLKAPELASLEDSYEHDNELATLVVGLSDITIVNMAMENTAEMRDTLQIVVHAFLRMKEIGKKSNCQFVHQNVNDVTAYDNNMRDRKKLLEQLNVMTEVAAKMEKRSGIKSFSDIMEYNLERDNWYIPGLWYGVPPMASINSGYSDNVYELKKYLFEWIGKCKDIREPQNIREFIIWIKSLWNSIKYEKFIFSFRNSLVAEAYDQLSIKFSQWEWKFRKQVHNWLINTENTIKNQSIKKLQPKCTDFKNDLLNVLYTEEKNMLELLEKHFDSKSDNVHLIEKYREDFSRGVKCLRNELERSVSAKIDEAIRIRKGKTQMQNIMDSYQRDIEEKVSSLLEQVRNNNVQVGDTEVRETFENMWKETLASLPTSHLEKLNVSQEMLQELYRDMANKGSSINEKFLKCLDNIVKNDFQPTKDHVDMKWYTMKERCFVYVTRKVNKGEDYDRTYCQELLNIINEKLRVKEVKNLHITYQFELDIKSHILGEAAPRFQVMHDKFIQENDPVQCLDKLKPHYWSIFENIFKERDETQSRASQFCELCLKPAIDNHIDQHLGKDIVDDILHGAGTKEYCSRTFFQYTVLMKLLEMKDFPQFVKYINSYESFVKEWIMNYISDTYQGSKRLHDLQRNILSRIMKDIREVLTNPEIAETSTVCDFLERFCTMLKSKLVIDQNEMKVIVFQNKSDVKQLSKDIEMFLGDTETEILSEMECSRTESVLSKLPMKPEDELFRKVFGCGEQCPFCKVPCEAGGSDHKEHFASVHRPEGLGRYIYDDSKKLVTEICSTAVASSSSFRNLDTKYKWHPYKEYRTFYPDWAIQPDPSITASDYWKYIFRRFNNEFAKEYNAKPADLPQNWSHIIEEKALQSLNEIFKMK